MNKFHITVSRRDFMKGLGLAGAGLGAAATATPVFRDIDELTSSPKVNFKHPWYVRELEFEKPSVDIDWSQMQVWDNGTDPDALSFACGYGSKDPKIIAGHQYRQVTRLQEQQNIQEQGLQAGTPGYALRDVALNAGAGGGYRPIVGSQFYGSGFGPDTTWDGPRVTTPEALGVPKWTGTPEEAINMVRAAAHLFGSANIGVLELTSNTRKMWQPSGTRFEDVDVGYEDGGVKVIPNNARYAICFVVGQSTEMTKRGITQQQHGASAGYSHGPIIMLRLQKFLKTLGYQALKASEVNVATGVLAGTGELTRISHQITYQWGPIIRYTPALITDLPLAPTKPIDAGLFRFCKTCKTCAKTCQELNGQTPLSLETEPTWETTGPWNRTGVKAFHIMWPWCNYICPYCQGSCPFGSHDLSAIHTVARATQAITPIFNGFLTNMNELFGYGLKDSEEECEGWWERDLNTWQHDTIFR